tara:strand:- start:432 stop:734 length:303 start_codon:yes stop_codon:yes gene_type:complete
MSSEHWTRKNIEWDNLEQAIEAIKHLAAENTALRRAIEVTINQDYQACRDRAAKLAEVMEKVGHRPYYVLGTVLGFDDANPGVDPTYETLKQLKERSDGK